MLLMRATRRSGRAFTLLEVMIAVIIMGLGVLGMSALFAGAVRQQQAASQVNKTVGVTNNASEVLRRKLGRITGDFQQCRQFMNLEDRQWAPIPADPDQGWALSISGMCDTIYFLADAPGDTLLEVGTDFLGAPTTPGVEGRGRSDQLPITPDAIPRSSLHPLSYTIEVRIGLSGGAIPGGPVRFIEREPDGSAPPEPQQVFENEVTLYRADASASPLPLSEATHDHIVVDRRIDPDGPDPDRLAFIRSFDFTKGDGNTLEPGLVDPSTPSGGQRFVERITITDFKTRTTGLISLNDRLVFEEDSRFPRGRRPSLGFALMYRRVGENAQIAYFTYTLAPLSVPDIDSDERAYIPPELYEDWPESEPEDLLREVEVVLRYDQDLERYFIEADLASDPTTDERWIVEPGQWLLMSSEDGVGGSSTPDPGADAAVQVLFQRPDPNDPNKVQGVLANPPRYPGLTAELPPGSEGNQRIHVWALQPIISAPDEADDETDTSVEWRVRPAAEPVIFTIATP